MAMTEASKMSVWTIGHSKHESQALLDLLQANNIQVLVDVRTAPYSKMAPQFNQAALSSSLTDAGIRYLHMGKELGGRPDGDHMYDENGYVFYNLVAETELFSSGIDRLIEGIEKFRVAIMCSEGNPDGCHRTLLVGRVLQQHGVKVLNILPNGETNELQDLNGSRSEQTLFGEEVEVKEWKSAVSVRQATQPKDSLEY